MTFILSLSQKIRTILSVVSRIMLIERMVISMFPRNRLVEMRTISVFLRNTLVERREGNGRVVLSCSKI